MVDDEGDWLDPPWPKFFGGVALAPIIDGFQVARNWVKYVDTGMSHSIWEKKKKEPSTDGLAWIWVGSKLVKFSSMLTGGCKGRTKNFLLGEPKYQNFYYAIGSMGVPII